MSFIPLFLRTDNNYDMDEVSRETACVPDVDPDNGEVLESMTQQQFATEVDINEIVRRFGLTGQLPENYREPLVGDFDGIVDYHTALNAVIAAEENFMLVPATVREEFGNDPQKLLQFVSNKDNRDKAIELGLIARPPEKTRDVVQAVDELAAKIVPPVK